MKTLNRGLLTSGLAVFLATQFGCSDDQPVWNLNSADAGTLDASVSTETETPDTSGVSGDSTSALGGGKSTGSDAGYTDGTASSDTSADTSTASGDGETTDVGVSTSGAVTTSETPTSSDEPTSSDVPTTSSDEPTSSDDTSTTSDVPTSSGTSTSSDVLTSSDDTSTTSDVLTSSDDSSTSGEPPVPTSVDCWEECSIECFPSCLRGLLLACEAGGSCIRDGETSCWDNGVRSERTVDGLNYVRTLYNAGGEACISTDRTFDPGTFNESFVWRNGQGDTVATGEYYNDDDSEATYVTCVEDGSQWLFWPADDCDLLEVSGWRDDFCSPGSCEQ